LKNPRHFFRLWSSYAISNETSLSSVKLDTYGTMRCPADILLLNLWFRG
jgi:hypothetical protein